MKRSKFTEEQIVGILREQEAGEKTAEVCRRHGVSSAAFCAWKAKYGGMEVSDAKRLRALEEENGKLKRLLAEAMLGSEPLSAIGPRTMASVLKGLLGRKGGRPPPGGQRSRISRTPTRCASGGRGPGDRRGPVLGPLSQERPADAPVRERLRALAAERRRFGYRRLHVLLRQEGLVMNRKRTERLYLRGGPDRPEATRPQACDGNAGADSDGSGAERALVGRFRP